MTTYLLGLIPITAVDYDVQYADSLVPRDSTIKVSNGHSYTVTDPNATHYRRQLVRALHGEIYRAQITVGQYLDPDNVAFKGYSSNPAYGRIDTTDILNIGDAQDFATILLFQGAGENDFRISTDLPGGIGLKRVLYHDSNGNYFRADIAASEATTIFTSVIIDNVVTSLDTTSILNQLSPGDTIDIVIVSNFGVTEAEFLNTLPGYTPAITTASSAQDIPSNRIITLPAVTAPNYYRIRLITPTGNTLLVTNNTSYTVTDTTATEYQTIHVNALTGEIYRARITTGESSGHKGYITDYLGLDTGTLDTADILGYGTTDDVQSIYMTATHLFIRLKVSIPDSSKRVFFKQGSTVYYVDAPTGGFIQDVPHSWTNVIRDGAAVSVSNVFDLLDEGDALDVVIADDTVTITQFDLSKQPPRANALHDSYDNWQEIPDNRIITIPSSTPNYYRIQCANVEYGTPVVINPVIKLASTPQSDVAIKVANTTSYTLPAGTANRYQTQLVAGLSGEIFRARVTVGLNAEGTQKGYGSNFGSIDNEDILGNTTVDDISNIAIFSTFNTFNTITNQIVLAPNTPVKWFYNINGNTFYITGQSRSSGSINILSYSAYNENGQFNFSDTTIFADLSVDDTFDFVLTTDTSVTLTQFTESLLGGTNHALAASYSEWQDIPSDRIITLPAVTGNNYYRIRCANITDTFEITTGNAQFYQLQHVNALPGEVFRARITVEGFTHNEFRYKGYHRASNRNYGQIDTADILGRTGILNISRFELFTVNNATPQFAILAAPPEANTTYRVFYSGNGEQWYIDTTSDSSLVLEAFVSSATNSTGSFNFADTMIYENLSEDDTIDVVITSDTSVTIQRFAQSLPGHSMDALFASYSTWQHIPLNDIIPLTIIEPPDYYRLRFTDSFPLTSIANLEPQNPETTSATSGNYFIPSGTATKYRTRVDGETEYDAWQDIPTTTTSKRVYLPDPSTYTLADNRDYYYLNTTPFTIAPYSLPNVYWRIQCADRLTYSGTTITPVNAMIKVSNDEYYTITSPTATKYRIQAVGGLPGEFFRARITVGISGDSNVKGYSSTYGSVDTTDALGVTGTEDLNLSVILVTNDRFQIRISVPPDTLNLDDSSTTTPNYRFFYYDEHGNSFYAELGARETYNPPRIDTHTTNWQNADGGYLTSSERNAIEQALNAGDTFDFVIVANRTVTLTDALTTMTGTNTALQASYSPWYNIPTHKRITLPAATTGQKKLVKIPTSLLYLNYLPFGYPIDAQVLATYTGYTGTLTTFYGIFTGQGQFTQDTQTINGVEYVMTQIFYRYSENEDGSIVNNELTITLTSTGLTQDQIRTNLANNSFYIYRTETNGDLNLTRGIERYDVADNTASSTSHTFRWTPTETGTDNILYSPQGHIGTKLAPTPTT